MVKKRRSADEIKAQIISVVLKHGIITSYKVFGEGTSSAQTKSYFEYLERKRFLRRKKIGAKTFFFVADRDKCKRWLKAFDKLKEIEEE
jgi:predicted transcriptional regulator